MSDDEGGSVASAAVTGDRLVTLQVLRDRLARQLDACDSARDVATLAARLTDVMAEIADLAPPAEEKGTRLDEVGARRAARGAATKSEGGSGGVRRSGR